MLAHSPKDRSRSPHRTNGTTVTQTNPTSSSSSSSRKHSPNQTDANTTPNNNNNSQKTKKENESQLRMKSLKSFIQTLINDSSSLGSTYEEQVKTLENACAKEFRDLSHERIRRVIRSLFKGRKSHQSSHTTNAFSHQEQSNNVPTTSDRFNSNENNTKKSRSNSTSTHSTTKTSDLATPSTLSGFDPDFLRHAFSQQFRPSLDLSAYFPPATTTNGTNPTSSLFRPNFSPSNFLQSLTAPPPPPLPTTLVSPHTHTNGTNESSTTNVNKLPKQMKLSTNETNSIKVLVNAYREAASYLSRSADELEQLM